jgi:hypothetical protein
MKFLRSLFKRATDDFPAGELLDYEFLEQLAAEGSTGFSEGQPLPHCLYTSFINPYHHSKLEYPSFLAELNSGSFINFLERVTGSSKLLADPHFLEAGITSLTEGDYFLMPEGGVVHPEFGLTRVLTVLVNMSGDWQYSWGGLPRFNSATNSFFLSGSCLVIQNDGEMTVESGDQLKNPASASLKVAIAHYYTKLR